MASKGEAKAASAAPRAYSGQVTKMAHELVIDSVGNASIALRGGSQTAWHGLGQTIEPGDSVKVIQKKAGLDWQALASPMQYTDADGNSHDFEKQQVIYRSDTRAALGTTSTNRYHIVQPAQVMEFFGDFLGNNGLSIETAGAVRGGRIIWCLAKLGKDYDFLMPGKDAINGYVRLDTSFDGSRATALVATTIRQVCANTMRMIDNSDGKNSHKTAHSTKFDAVALQKAFGLLGEQHRMTAEVWNALAKRKVTTAESNKFFGNLFGVDVKDIGKTDKEGKKVVSTRTENMINQLAMAYAKGPGAGLKSANGTAFGLLNAVTYWVDHQSTSQDNYDDGSETARRNSAWFGLGEKTKQDAQYFAAELAGCTELLAA